MSTMSASPADPVGAAAAAMPSAPGPDVSAGHDGPAAAHRPVLVWDAPVRVVHWLLVACFAGAWLSAESERWRLLHVTLGTTMAALVVFRLLWGVVGTRHARFAGFVRGPAAVLGYFRSLWGPRPQHHVGHNPAGGLAILALLGLAALLTASGLAMEHAWLAPALDHWLEETHEVVAHALLILVGVHIAAVVLSSRLHRENLVGAMVTGRKPAPDDQAVGRWPARAAAVVALVVAAAVAGYWAWQWQQAGQRAAPAGTLAGMVGSDGAAWPQAAAERRPDAAATGRHEHRGHDDDDD